MKIYSGNNPPSRELFIEVFDKHYNHIKFENFVHKINMTGRHKLQTFVYIFVFLIYVGLFIAYNGTYISERMSNFIVDFTIIFSILFFFVRGLLGIIIHVRHGIINRRIRDELYREGGLFYTVDDISLYIKLYIPDITKY